MQTARRTQHERSAATTKELVGAARTHFARAGYAAASLDAICADAGITKGALYHHFRNKRDLFRAVYEAEQRRLRAAVADAFRACADPWDGMREGVRAFLAAAVEPGAQRITLLDAPGALGWQTMREVQQDCRAMTRHGLELALGDDAPPPGDLEALTSAVFGAQCECAMTVAHADDPRAARAAALRQLHRVLDAVASGAGASADAG